MTSVGARTDLSRLGSRNNDFRFANTCDKRKAQSIDRGGANERGHVVAAARIASCIDLEQLAAQHVGDKLVDVALRDQFEPPSRRPLDLQRIVGAGADIGEHQAGHALGFAGGNGQCRTTAQREADDRRALDLERVEHADQIAGEMTGGISRSDGGGVGQAVAALIVSDDAEAVSQRQNLVKPHSLAAGEAVQQHHGRTVADVADGDSQVADLDFIHAVSPIVPDKKNHADMIGNCDDDKRCGRHGPVPMTATAPPNSHQLGA